MMPHPRRLLLLFLCFDLLVLLLHLTLGPTNHFFHLDFEHNLPTWYQSAKLLGFGLLFVAGPLIRPVSRTTKFFLIPLGLFLTGLGLDELLQIHENIYRIFELFEWLHPSRIVEASMKMGYRSSLWMLYYIPVIMLFVFWSGYWLRYFQSQIRSNAWLIGLSSVCLLAVLLAEILSSTGQYSPGTYFWLVTIEETAEMLLASSLLVVGGRVVEQRVSQM